MAKLGDICTVGSGSTPKTGVAEYWDGTVKWITPAELNEDSFYITDSVRHITECGKEKTGLSYLPKGTVILSSRAPIGKTAIAGCEMCCNQGFKNLICSDAVYNEYLYFFLKSKTDYLNSLGRGATFKEISKSIVEKIEIPLPNIEKQHQIVKELKATRNLIAHRKQQLTKLDELVKARFVEMFGDPANNPHKWKTLSFKQAGVRLSDGPFGSNLKSAHYTDSGVRVIRLGNIGVGKFIDNDRSYISLSHYECLKKYTCRAGEIVIGTLGDPNLRACIIPSNIKYAVNKADCVHYIPNPTLLNTYFVCQYINCPETLLLATKMIHGQTRSRVSSGQLAQLQIFVPPLSLQNQFADFVAEVDKSKVEVQKALDQTQLLFDSLMQQYFG